MRSLKQHIMESIHTYKYTIKIAGAIEKEFLDMFKYILWVNRDHQVTNKSTENRYHIIMDAYDTKGVTKNFKYAGDINSLQRDADSFRQNIDAVTLSGQEIQYFESLRQQFLK